MVDMSFLFLAALKQLSTYSKRSCETQNDVSRWNRCNAPPLHQPITFEQTRKRHDWLNLRDSDKDRDYLQLSSPVLAKSLAACRLINHPERLKHYIHDLSEYYLHTKILVLTILTFFSINNSTWEKPVKFLNVNYCNITQYKCCRQFIRVFSFTKKLLKRKKESLL